MMTVMMKIMMMMMIFKVGVHFDADDTVFSPVAADKLTSPENAPTSKGSGIGYTGFYLNYWQSAC